MHPQIFPCGTKIHLSGTALALAFLIVTFSRSGNANSSSKVSCFFKKLQHASSYCVVTLIGPNSSDLHNIFFKPSYRSDGCPPFLQRQPHKIASNFTSIQLVEFNYTRESRIKQRKRFSSYCNSFITFTSNVKPNWKFVLDQLIHFSAPAHDFFAFISPEAQLSDLKSTKVINDLRFVTGLASDTGEIFTKSTDLFSSSKDLNFQFGLNLNGAHFNLGILPVPPFLLKGSSGEFDRGICFMLFTSASTSYNFTFKFIFPLNPKEGTGKRRSDGSWTGTQGDVYSGRTDIVTALSPSPERLFGPFEFTSFYLAASGAFVTAHPRLKVRWETVVQPLQASAWMAVLLSMFLYTFVVCAILVSAILNGYATKKLEGAEIFLWPFLTISLPALLGQSVRQVPSKVRPITAIWLIFALIVGTGYKERLFGFITFPKYEETPKTMKQLAEFGQYKVIYSWWPSVQYYNWEKSPQPDFKNVFNRFQKDSSPFRCVLKAALEPDTACVAYEFELLTGMAANLTYDSHFQPLFMTKERYFESYVALAFRHGSIYLDSWKWIVSSLRDFGLTTRWMMNEIKHYRDNGYDWLKHQGDSRVSQEIKKIQLMSTKTAKALSASHLVGLFILYLLFISVSIVSFVLEWATWARICCVGWWIYEVLMRMLVSIL